MAQHLLLLLLSVALILLLCSLGLLSPHTTRATTTKWRCKRKVNVLLGVETDNERGNVDDLLADTDVALADENTGVVNRLGETELVDTSLQAALKEIFNLQGQHVIETHTALVENTDTDETTDEGVSFEKTLGVLLVKGKKLTMDKSSGYFVLDLLLLCAQGHTGQHDGSWRG